MGTKFPPRKSRLVRCGQIHTVTIDVSGELIKDDEVALCAVMARQQHAPHGHASRDVRCVSVTLASIPAPYGGKFSVLLAMRVFSLIHAQSYRRAILHDRIAAEIEPARTACSA
jgi:hypothetical protein